VSQLGPHAYLAATALLAVLSEADTGILLAESSRFPGCCPVSEFVPYLRRRVQPGQSAEPLPDLPVPEAFGQLFRDWADGRVSLSS